MCALIVAEWKETQDGKIISLNKDVYRVHSVPMLRPELNQKV